MIVHNFILRVHDFIVSVGNFILRVGDFILPEQEVFIQNKVADSELSSYTHQRIFRAK